MLGGHRRSKGDFGGTKELLLPLLTSRFCGGDRPLLEDEGTAKEGEAAAEDVDDTDTETVGLEGSVAPCEDRLAEADGSSTERTCDVSEELCVFSSSASASSRSLAKAWRSSRICFRVRLLSRLLRTVRGGVLSLPPHKCPAINNVNDADAEQST